MKQVMLKYKYRMLILAGLTFVFVVFDLVNTLILGEIINNVVAKNKEKLQVSLLIAFFAVIITYSLYFLKRMYKVKLIKRIIERLRFEVMRGFFSQSEKAFSSSNKGEYISQINYDLKLIEENYFDTLFELFQVLSFFIIAIFALTKISFLIAMVIFVLSLMPIWVTFLTKTKLMELREASSQKSQVLTDHLKQNLDGYYQIKQYNKIHLFLNKFNRANLEYEGAKFEFSLLQSKVVVASEIVGAFVKLIPLAIGAFFAIQGKLEIGDIIIINQLLSNVTRPVVIISNQYSNLKSMTSINERILKWTKIKSDNNSVNVPDFKSVIKFKNVSYSYDEKSNVLSDINLEIFKNEKIAIAGKSGSGKSTILKLITKVLDDYSGDIFIDDENLKSYSSQSIYELITVIPAKPYIFNDTLYNNITMYEAYEEAEVVEVIKATHLDDVYNRIGLNKHFISEDAYSISSGEAQKIAIARAYIRNKKVLICDEITSALDIKNTRIIDDLLLSLHDTTLIVVTHKLSSDILSKYNRVVTLRNGKIISNKISSSDEIKL